MAYFNYFVLDHLFLSALTPTAQPTAPTAPTAGSRPQETQMAQNAGLEYSKEHGSIMPHEVREDSNKSSYKPSVQAETSKKGGKKNKS